MTPTKVPTREIAMSDVNGDELHLIIRGLVERHHAELDKLRDENRRLAKENESLWLANHEAEDAIRELRAMNERAREDA